MVSGSFPRASSRGSTASKSGLISSTAVASVRAGKIVLEPTELEDDLREMLGDA